MTTTAEQLSGSFDPSEGGVSPTRGMLGEHRGEDFSEYGDRFGRVRVWHFGHRVGVLESSGGLERAHAEFVVAYFGEHLDGAEAPRYGFCNWLAVTAYTAEVRKILTDWQVRQHYEALHVAQTSRLLAMSVSLANMVLEREIRTYETLEDVHRVFQSTMRRHGLHGLLTASRASLRPIR